MAAPKLKSNQRLLLLKLIAADYSNELIFHKLSKLNSDCEPRKLDEDFKPLDDPFPEIGASTLSYYRDKFKDDIERLRAERRDKALTTGLALKSERVARLQAHADHMETILYVADVNGRMWNCREWRQSIEDIALEMGERRPKQQEGEEQVIKVYIGINPDLV